jgi:hypothetical protein
VPSLKEIVDEYMARAVGVKKLSEKCLRTERWGGKVVLMVIDAAFTSIGMNYFTTVVPKVAEFDSRFILRGQYYDLKELANADLDGLRGLWKNERSWALAKGIASNLSKRCPVDRDSLRSWAADADLESWEDDPIGKIKGTGIVTYQYLRMMGGVDTVMPDKIVKRVINGIFEKADMEKVEDSLEFVKKAEKTADLCGYRPIELCWMTWLIQQEGSMMKIEKYASVIKNI